MGEVCFEGLPHDVLFTCRHYDFLSLGFIFGVTGLWGGEALNGALRGRRLTRRERGSFRGWSVRSARDASVRASLLRCAGVRSMLDKDDGP